MTQKIRYIVVIGFLLIFGTLLSACAKHSYQTREGKKRLKYYNRVQYFHDAKRPKFKSHKNR